MPEHTPRVPEEAVEVAAIRAYNRTFGRDDAARDLWCEFAGQYTQDHYRDQVRPGIEDALPAIHAERDRAWREALNGEGEIDQARAALAEVDRIAGNWRHVNEDAAAILHAVEPLRSLIENTESALDSLQVSGAGEKCPTCGSDGPDIVGQDFDSGMYEAECGDEWHDRFIGTDKPLPDTTEVIAEIGEALAADQPDPPKQAKPTKGEHQ